MIEDFVLSDLKKLYIPPSYSHKGQNGKLLVIGGSKLFHAASLWSLKVASRIVDMVFYASVPENNLIVQKAKEEFRDGIVISRNKIENYIDEADCVLIGPGLPREQGEEIGDDSTKELTGRLLEKYPHKKWVIDGGSLQVIDPSLIPNNAILTPHKGEFEKLFSRVIPNLFRDRSYHSKVILKQIQYDNEVKQMAKKYNCVILLKGQIDIVCGSDESLRPPQFSLKRVKGGNAGMTKGGTGDVLAGLVASLYCRNDAFLSACAGSFLNKKAGEELFKRAGCYFNASDLTDEIPQVMKKYLLG